MCAIILLNLLLQKIVQQERQYKKQIPHIHSPNSSRDFVSPSDAIKNIADPCSNGHKTVVHASKTANTAKEVRLHIIHRIHMVLSELRLLIMFRLLSIYLANILYLDYISHLRFPIFANASCQQLAKPLLQFFCCQTIGSIFQKLQNVVPILSENCHNEANDNAEVNLVHRISQQELMDTTVCHFPERIEQQVGTTLGSACFIM